jgi:outer membrane protein OmpA-like peptidoglycan-associated protein
MPPARPMLDDLELQQTQQLEIDEDEDFATHEVPALEGDFDQGLGRRGAAVTLSGVLTGPEAGDGLKSLREKFRAGEAVPFAADIATATKLDKVLVEEMGVRELAGRPQRFEYAFRLREFTPPPPPETTPPPPAPPEPPPDVGTAILEVEVTVEGEPDFDFAKVTMTVDGTQSDGKPLSRTLTNRTGNVWTETGLPPGSYTAQAVVTDPAMTGTASVALAAGERKRVQITLRRGAIIATAFVVHFRFDKSLVEPCMRPVLRQVMQRAGDSAHQDEKIVIVGHTDKSGPDRYNQSLSERRARSVFAFLTSGRAAAAAQAEWGELRRPAAGALPTIHDTWGAHEYQYMLQDLGFYPGNVDGDHRAQTDEAVETFRAAKGLPAGTTVDDATWDALIADYLAQDQATMVLDENRLLRNAKDGCDGGALKWLGCGEESPLPQPKPPRGDAFRPYRRVEILFVRADRLPCEPPRPDTLDLPPPPPGTGRRTWCLGPERGANHCCFATRDCGKASPGRWCIVSAETDTVSISGKFTFEDGSAAPNVHFVLIAPDGEYMGDERESQPNKGDGMERSAGADGSFSFPTPKGVGIVTIEARGEFVARLRGQPLSAAKGNVICARVNKDGKTGGSISIVLTPFGPKAPAVNPTITLASSAVVVPKPHTNPGRVAVTLGTDGPFFRSGTLTRSSAAIRFFTAATGGTEITFNGTDNVFTGAQLTAGVQLFAEGAVASAAPDDVVLTLTLTTGRTPVGPPAVATMTSVELTLDICGVRPAPGVDPPPLSATDKINPGRFLGVQEPGNRQERAMVIVRPPNPGAFTGDLVVEPTNNLVQLFADEVAAAGQAPLATPQVIPSATIPPNGTRFFAQGAVASTAVRDAGIRLGLRNVEPTADRVAITVVQLEFVTQPLAAAPTAQFARMGLWDNAFRANGTPFNEEAEADNFVGADTRRFHLRVRDPSRAGRVEVDWRTLTVGGADRDAPANPSVTLLETAAGSGVFVSRGLMLVSDVPDRDEPTHSGLPGGAPSGQARGETNHRTRLADIDGSVRAEYRATGARPIVAQVPVFQRNPDERRRVPLQVFVLRVAPGGAGIIKTAPGEAVWRTDLRVMLETYARIGIRVETVVAPGTPAADIARDGALSLVLIDPPAGVNPANLTTANETPIATQHPGLPDTIRVFFIGGFATGNAGGVARIDAQVGAGDRRRGSAWTIQATGPYAATHEVGHILSNKLIPGHADPQADFHFSSPALPPGNRLRNDQNLMKKEFLGPEAVNGPKRLWDAADGDGFNQFTAMRGSHYTRNF